MSSPSHDYSRILQSPSTVSPETRSLLRNQIDLEIAELQNRLRYLATVRNALGPVYRLPREVLEKIFALVQVGVSGRVSVGRILPASWVSHEWRDVALGYPLLWDHISQTNTHWVNHILTRSNNTPLYVDLSEHALRNIRYGLQMHSLFKELPRFRNLWFRKDPDLDEWVDPQADDTTLSLSDDEVTSDASHHRLDPEPTAKDHSTKAIALLQALHASDAQDLTRMFEDVRLEHLTTLKLTGCAFNWEDVIFPSLKTLHVKTPAESSRLSISRLLDHLSMLPALEDLNLHYVISTPNPAEAGQRLRQLGLRHLSSFKIWDLPDVMITVLNHVSIPPNASLSITVDTPHYTEDLQRFIPFVAARFSSTQQLDTITISRNPSGHLSIGFGQRSDEDTVTTETTLHVRSQPGLAYYLGHMALLLNLLPTLSSVRELINGYWMVINDVPINFDALRQIFHLTPNLEELVLQGAAGALMLKHLERYPLTTFPDGIKKITYIKLSRAYDRLPEWIKALASREKRNQVRMILRDSYFEKLEGFFDEICGEEGQFLFFADDE